jgi:hypothetical protein
MLHCWPVILRAAVTVNFDWENDPKYSTPSTIYLLSNGVIA